MVFNIIIRNADGSLKWDIPFNSFSFTEELNQGKNAHVNLTLPSLQELATAYGVTVEFILSASYRELEIYDSAGNKIYYGYISEIQFDKGSGASTTISVSSKGFFSLLEKRLTSGYSYYSSEDSADIAWDLINETQSLDYGDLGLTRGSHPSTKTRDRTFRYKTVAEAIKKMSASEVKDGFDFDINNQKQFNIFYPKGSVRDNIFLEEDFNINRYAIYKTFIDGMANSVTVVGSGFDEENQLVVVRNSPDSYKEAFFLLEELLSETDVIIQETLEDKGDKYLETYQAPRYTITVYINYENPLFTDYEIGDWLNVKIPSFDIDTTYRINKMSCNEQGEVTLTLRGY